MRAAFDKLIFTEDVTVTDVTASTAQIGVIGASAADVVGRALGLDADAIRALPLLGAIGSEETFVVRADDVDSHRSM